MVIRINGITVRLLSTYCMSDSAASCNALSPILVTMLKPYVNCMYCIMYIDCIMYVTIFLDGGTEVQRSR